MKISILSKNSPSKKKPTTSIYIWGSINACRISYQLKLSASSLLPVASVSRSCSITYSFSMPQRNRTCTGDRGRSTNDAKSKTTVKRLSRIKIHDHPGNFPTPSIRIKPNARMPEKAPDIEAVEKNVDILGSKVYDSSMVVFSLRKPEVYLHCSCCRG